MSNFELLLAARTAEPLTAADREQLRLVHGNSWKFSTAARYEATLRAREADVQSLSATLDSISAQLESLITVLTGRGGERTEPTGTTRS